MLSISVHPRQPPDRLKLQRLCASFAAEYGSKAPGRLHRRQNAKNYREVSNTIPMMAIPDVGFTSCRDSHVAAGDYIGTYSPTRNIYFKTSKLWRPLKPEPHRKQFEEQYQCLLVNSLVATSTAY